VLGAQHAQIPYSRTISLKYDGGSLWLHVEIPMTLKGLDMTPQFLREEAIRFRGMAVTVDREASKLRLLTMAKDFESRAKAADDLTEPNLGEAIKGNTSRRIVKELNEAG
jgi:hypothetical protein